MKRILLLLILLCIINLDLSALTMKEKIQQDLSKVGVKQEIIDETITFDRLYAMDDSDLPLDIGEIIGIFERIYEKDERNYVAAKKVLQFYGRGISYLNRQEVLHYMKIKYTLRFYLLNKLKIHLSLFQAFLHLYYLPYSPKNKDYFYLYLIRN